MSPRKATESPDLSAPVCSSPGQLVGASVRALVATAADDQGEADPRAVSVLSQCDGERTVEEIAHGLTETFGEEAEPVLPRLVKYLQIAEANGWVGWKRTPDRNAPYHPGTGHFAV